MTQLRHAMADLETVALTEDAALVSIGAVIFDPRYNTVSKDTFYVELDWKHQGRKVDPETVAWWGKQNAMARTALHGSVALDVALDDLALWLPDDVRIWGNGPTFDIIKLEHAYRQFDMEIPWKFWNVRDCRTIKDMYESMRGGFDKKCGGNKHNALDDAIYQAEYVCEMWKSILGGAK